MGPETLPALFRATRQYQAWCVLDILGVNVQDRKKEVEDSADSPCCCEEEIVGIYYFSRIFYNEHQKLNNHLCESWLF